MEDIKNRLEQLEDEVKLLHEAVGEVLNYHNHAIATLLKRIIKLEDRQNKKID